MALVSLKLFQEFSFIFSASHAFTGCSIFRVGSTPHLLLFNSRDTRAGGGDRGFFVYLEIFFLTLTNCASRFGSVSLFLPLQFLLGGGGMGRSSRRFPKPLIYDALCVEQRLSERNLEPACQVQIPAEFFASTSAQILL